MKDSIQNILMIRRGAIGDIIFTLPAFYMLKANFPNSKISFLVKDNYAEVLKGFPGLDQVLIIKKRDLASKSISQLWKMSSDLYRTVQQNHYQLAIDFVGHGEHAFFLWLSGIPHRWGSIKTPKPLRQWFYTNYFIRELEDTHLIDQHLMLLEKGGLTRFPVKNQYVIPQENMKKATRLFQQWGLSVQKPTLFIQPFTGNGVAGKIWSLECYEALADYWNERGMQIIFGGGPAEREKLSNVAGRYPIAAGEADFVTSVGLASLASVVVGGDTGLMHAALAAGKRTVMLVGPTNYKRIGPYQHPEWAVRPQSGNLIQDIRVEQVLEATNIAFNDLGI